MIAGPPKSTFNQGSFSEVVCVTLPWTQYGFILPSTALEAGALLATDDWVAAFPLAILTAIKEYEDFLYCSCH